tara:strand:- start:23 stop:178 length:156 start_codon:yes stop_codon:yes gene_type:complete
MNKLDPAPENETTSERLQRHMKAAGIPIKTKEEIRQVLKDYIKTFNQKEMK